MKKTWWVNSSQLDEDQRRVMSLPIEGKYLVEGPPGSGKTNLLALRAKYLLLSKRENFVIITFTKSLRSFLKFGLSAYGTQRYDIYNYNQWAYNFLKEFGKPYPGSSDFKETRNEIIEIIKDLISSNKGVSFYDTILVDEAQDYNSQEINIFNTLAKNLFLVADVKQTIFPGAEKNINHIKDIVDDSISLKYHYRNGFKICDLADEVGQHPDSAKLINASQYNEEESPSRVEEVKTSSLDEAFEIAYSNIEEQLEAFDGENIGVIFPKKSVMEYFQDKLLGTPLYSKMAFHDSDHCIEFTSDTSVYGYVIHSAKGLEFRVVHMFGWDQDNMKGDFPRNRTYTAITRAKTILFIYYTEKLHNYLKGALSKMNPIAPVDNLDILLRSE